MIAESKRDHVKAFILSALFSFTSLFLVSQLRFKLSYQESTQGKPIVVELVEIPTEVPKSTPKPQKKVETHSKKEPKIAKKVELKEATPPKIESPIYEEVKQERQEKQEEIPSPLKGMQEESPKASGETPKEEAKAKEGAPSPPAPPPALRVQEQTRAGENLLAMYLSRVRSIVDRRKYYPPEAKRYGVEGKVSLRISVDASGRITQVELINSSGSRILDRAAQD